MIITAFRTGITQALRTWKMALLVTLASILFAVPVATLFVSTAIQTSALSFAARRLMADTLDPVWLIDFANEQLGGKSLASFSLDMGLMFLFGGVLFLVTNVLLSGGVLEVLACDDGRFSMKRFVSGVGTFLWRFVRLWLISLAIYGVTFFGYLIAIGVINSYEVTADAERPTAIAKWIATALLVSGFFLINLVFAYARIATVVNGSHRMIRETMLAIRFVLKRFFATLTLQVLALLLGLLLFALFTSIRSLIVQSSLTTVFVALIIGQLAILLRSWSRVVAYASALQFYRTTAPPVEMQEPFLRIVPEFATAIDTRNTN